MIGHYLFPGGEYPFKGEAGSGYNRNRDSNDVSGGETGDDKTS
jgi:hypothetical protein